MTVPTSPSAADTIDDRVLAFGSEGPDGSVVGPDGDVVAGPGVCVAGICVAGPGVEVVLREALADELGVALADGDELGDAAGLELALGVLDALALAVAVGPSVLISAYLPVGGLGECRVTATLHAERQW
jgi:hypothetical protein